jgi:hypothetical protein
MSCSVLATLFAVAATCAGLENVRCGGRYGVPSPTIEWFHSNLRVDGSTYNSSHLILHNVELSDAGRYLIVAKNTVGEARASFWLSVRGVARASN